MKKFVNTAFGLVLDYVPILLAVVAGGMAAVAAVRQTITPDEVVVWTLAVLVLLSTTQLVDRFRVIRQMDGKLDKALLEIDDLKTQKALFTTGLPDLEQRLRKAKTIAINGITLSRTSDTLWGVFRDCFGRGGKVRLLIVHPDDPAIELASKRFHKHQDAARIKREAEHALDNFESLTTQPRAQRGFQVKLGKFVPSFGIWMIDADTAEAEIWVEMYTYRDEPEPTFQLLPQRDNMWFKYFQRQFELMWDDALLWEPTPVDADVPKAPE